MNMVLSLMVLTALALVIGGLFLLRKGIRRQAWLMFILAVVLLLNVGISTMPTKGGASLAREATAP